MKKDKIMKVVVFVVVLLIPIIYSFFYLKSYWDPYGDLTDMKIALVNLDEGENGENQGKEFLQELKNNGTFNINETTLSEANQGMQDGNYYAMILIPDNFTKYLNSASTNDKQIATITYSPNQATNYLATQIINSAMKTIETGLEEKIDSKIVGTLADNLNEVPDSLEKISGGAGEILDGSNTLNSGMEQINDGTTTLSNKYSEFNSGVNSAYSGSEQLQTGINQASSGINELSTGTNQLDSAISQVNAGVDKLSQEGTAGITELSKGVSDLNTGATTLNKGVDGYVTGVENLTESMEKYITGVDKYNGTTSSLLEKLATYGATSTDPTVQALAVNAQAIIDSETAGTLKKSGIGLEAGADKLTAKDPKTQLSKSDELKAGAQSMQNGVQLLAQKSAGLTDLTDGITSLQSALQQVKTGITSLKNGFGALQVGTNSLQKGSANLSNGLGTLNTNSQTVKTSLETLSDGTSVAYDGTKTLVDGASEFKEQIDEGLDETNKSVEKLSGIEEFAENPVEFKTDAYGEVDSYGIAFTPLFLSIGLWVGALMCYVVLYYDQKKRFRIFGSHRKDKIVQNITYLTIGAIEGIITAALLKMGLGFEVQNISLYYFASALTGITFMSIIQCLIRNFDDVGKFLALIILVLQLAASGGTFPIETINPVFRTISNYLPMTYTIKLFREILVPTVTNFKGRYIWILIGITIVTLAITTIVDIIRNKKEKVAEENK